MNLSLKLAPFMRFMPCIRNKVARTIRQGETKLRLCCILCGVCAIKFHLRSENVKEIFTYRELHAISPKIDLA